MKSSTRLRALESTARVALGCFFGTAGACGGISSVDPPERGDTKATHVKPDPASNDGAPPTPAATATATAAPTATATATSTSPPAPTGSAPPAPSPTASAPQPTPEPAPTAEPPPPEPPAPMLACLPPITFVEGKLEPPLDETEHACCESYIADLMASGLAPTAPPAAEPIEPSLLNCCRALAYSSLWENTPAHTVCCGARLLAEQDFNQPYCSPWGPPMPPALVLA